MLLVLHFYINSISNVPVETGPLCYSYAPIYGHHAPFPKTLHGPFIPTCRKHQGSYHRKDQRKFVEIHRNS